jgi:hypothetical protein
LKHLTTTAAVLGTLALVSAASSGCEEKPAKVTAHGTAKVKDGGKVKPVGDDAPNENSTPPVKLGDTVKVGDWMVRVTAVNTNANAVIHSANMFNDPPKGQYVLVTYTAKYTGHDRTGDPTMDLEWTMTTPDHKVHDTAMAVTPSEEGNGWPTETRTGGTVRGQEAFDVPAAQVHRSLVSVQDFLDDNYADFPLR